MLSRAASTAKAAVLLEQESGLRAVEAFPWASLEAQRRLAGEGGICQRGRRGCDSGSVRGRVGEAALPGTSSPAAPRALQQEPQQGKSSPQPP